MENPFSEKDTAFRADWNSVVAPGGFTIGTGKALSPEYIQVSSPGLGIPAVYVSGGTMDISVSLNTSDELSVTLSNSPNGIEAIVDFAVSGFIEAKINTDKKALRTRVCIQANTNGIYWGFTSLCPFRIYKNQFVSIPAKDYFSVYVKSTIDGGQIALSES